MTLQELIDWARNHGVEDFSQCELEYNSSESDEPMWFGVHPGNLELEETEDQTNGTKYQTILIGA